MDPENAGYGISESPIFKKHFLGEHSPGPPPPPPSPPSYPYIIRAFGADRPFLSPVTWYLMFSYKKTPYPDKTNDDTESEWSRSLNTKEYKTRLSCHWEKGSGTSRGGARGAPLIFRPKWGWKGRKKFSGDRTPPPPISGSGWPDSPLIFKGLDRPPIGDQKSSWITNLEENSLWISWHYIVLFNNRNTRIIVSCLLSLVQMRTVKRPWWERIWMNMWLSHVNGGWYTVHTVVFHSLNTTKR